MPRRMIKEWNSNSEFLLCRLCRHPYRQITPTHLFWKHRTDCETYADRFPRAPFMAPDTLRHLSESIIANWERLGQHWTKDRVERDIRNLEKRGQRLHARAVKDSRPPLFGAALRLYGSWEGALRAAGLDPRIIRRRMRWDERALLEAIRDAHACGLLRRGASYKATHKNVIQAAAARWGSWRAAQEAAGLEPLRPAQVRWTRREVRKRIAERVRRNQSLLASQVHGHAPGLKRAAERLFKKPWPDLIRSLGFAYDGRQRWSHEKVIRIIRRLRKLGRSLRWKDVRREDPPAAQAAARHFGSWPKALRAAGVDPSTLRARHWSRGELLLLFKRLKRSGGLTRRVLRSVRRSGYVQPANSLSRYWESLAMAIRVMR